MAGKKRALTLVMEVAKRVDDSEGVSIMVETVTDCVQPTGRLELSSGAAPVEALAVLARGRRVVVTIVPKPPEAA